MKLHEMEGLLRGKCLPGDMKVNETNAEYLVRKFCELEAQVKQLDAERDAVVAENATLKDINAWCKTDAFKNMYREFKTAESLGCPDVDCMHDAMLVAIMHAPQTPVTDAAIASLRAEGAEMFAAKCRSELSDLPTTAGNTFDESHTRLRNVIFIADDFAAQLRSQYEQVKGGGL